MNHAARFPAPTRPVGLNAVLSGLGAALRDTAAFVFVREAHAYFAPPPALRQAPTPRARRFMRGGE